MSFGVEIYDSSGGLYLSTDSVGLVAVDYFSVNAGSNGSRTYSELQGVTYRYDLFFAGNDISSLTVDYDNPPIDVSVAGDSIIWTWSNTEVVEKVTILVWAE